MDRLPYAIGNPMSHMSNESLSYCSLDGDLLVASDVELGLLRWRFERDPSSRRRYESL